MTRLAILGDSIGYGIGATATSDTLAARLGTGLTAAGVPTETRVFAQPGACSAELTYQLRSALPWRPDVAVVVIGANDLIRLVRVETAAAALAQAVTVLRAAGAEVVVAPAPDLSVVPHVPPALRAMVQAAGTRLRRAQSEAALAAGARVVDATGTAAAFAGDRALFAADRFHPSSAGYAVIASALEPAVTAAALAATDGTASAG